jgi:histone H3
MARVLAEPPADVARRLANEGMVALDDLEKPARPSKMKQIREIKKHQSTAELILPKEPFERLVREIARQRRADIKFQTPAMEALKEAAEEFVVKAMEDGLVSTLRDHRRTLTRRDVALALRLRDR